MKSHAIHEDNMIMMIHTKKTSQYFNKYERTVIMISMGFNSNSNMTNIHNILNPKS